MTIMVLQVGYSKLQTFQCILNIKMLTLFIYIILVRNSLIFSKANYLKVKKKTIGQWIQYVTNEYLTNNCLTHIWHMRGASLI